MLTICYASNVARFIHNIWNLKCFLWLNLQTDGMTIHAERLNFHRYISHFRSVHRGAAFAKMRTTSVRKLLPEYVILLEPFSCCFLASIVLIIPMQVLGFPLSSSYT